MVRATLPIVERTDDEFFGALKENESIFLQYLKEMD